MKRIISLIILLGLITTISACGKVEVAMQEIYDASHLNALLENHESVYVKSIESGMPYEETYMSKDYTYSLYEGEYYGMSSDFAFLTTDKASYSYSEGNYIRTLLITQDGFVDNYRSEDNAVFVFGPETVNETIKSVTKKDNRIIVTSSQPQESNESSDEWGLVSYDCEYVLDAKTRELISSKSVSEYSDGTVYDIVSEFYYDAEVPEGLKAFLEYDQQTEDLRTITVISNPGAENEKVESVQVPKGLTVSLESDLYSEETFAMYADAACTEPFAFSEDLNSDVTIYVKWAE